MAFFDNPKVDENSEISEESVAKTREIFSRKNSFIAREENPDYGVDLDIEIIDSKNEASGDKFAIQIKSTSNPNFISKNNNEFISLPFSNSRLGYLARRKPGLGLIILYDAIHKKLYFDYIEEIIFRISKEKGHEEWKNQESVTIHIPINNILNEESGLKIYKKFVLRFKNHSLMLKTHSDDYDIPFIDNYDSELTSEEIVKTYGPHLVTSRKFKELAYFIQKIPRKKILNEVKLTLIAALTYCELSDLVEAQYFLSKLKISEENFSDFEKGLFSLIEPKIRFSSGDIDFFEFKSTLSNVNMDKITGVNKINLLGQLIQLESLDKILSNYFSRSK